MRETGVVRLRLGEEPKLAAAYIGIGRVQLGIMKQFMVSLNLQQLTRQVTLTDGTVITCSSVFGQDQISIVVSAVAEELPVSAPSVSSSSAVIEFPFIISASGFGLATSPSGFNAQIGNLTVSFGVVNDAIVAITEEVDEDRARLGAIARLLQRGNFAIAEVMLNSMDRTGDPLDGALLCDEGFFVDPTIYSGKAYEALLLKIAEPHLQAFNHDTAMPITYPIFADYNRTYHGSSPEKYQDAFFVFDGPPESPKRTLWNTCLSGAGGALVSTVMVSFPDNASLVPEFPGFDSLSLGTAVLHEQMFRSQASDTVYSARAEVDLLYYRTQLLMQRYYTVSISTPTSTRADLITQAGGFFDCPNDGQLTQEVLRVRRRRTPGGWIDVVNTTQGPDATIMPFTKDAKDMAFGGGVATAISGPADSAEGTGIFLQDHTIPINYVKATYTKDANFSYASGPRGFDSIFTRPPQGTFAFAITGSTTTVRMFYGGNLTPVLRDGTERTLTRYVGPTIAYAEGVTARNIFEANADGHIKVLDINGAVTVDISPLFPATFALDAGDLPTAIETMEWTQPSGMAAVADFYAASRINGRLQIYNPIDSTRPNIAPPVTAFTSCVYIPRAGKYLYLRLKDASENGALNFLFARLTYLVGLTGQDSGFASIDNAGTVAERKAALFDLVDVLANTGVPLELMAFADFLSAAPTLIL